MGISIEQYRSRIGRFSCGKVSHSGTSNTNILDTNPEIEDPKEPSLLLKGPWKLHAVSLVLFCLCMTLIPATCHKTLLVIGGVEQHPGPTSITTEDDTRVLTGLIADFENQDTKDVIATYDPTHTWEQHINRMNKFKIAKLRSACADLKIDDSQRTLKDELIKKIVKRIQVLLPEICMYCEEKYTVLPNDNPVVCCYVCKHGIHTECIKTQLQTNNSTEEVFKIEGIVWICDDCDAAQKQKSPDKRQTAKTKTKTPEAQNAGPSNSDIQEIPDEDDEEEPGETEHHNTPATHEREQDTPVCIHYKRGACRYGMSGQGCQFRHPRPCRKLLNHGNRTNGGCNKGRKCEFLHPQMCYNSLYKNACHNSECKFKHVRGTWKKEPGSHENIPRHHDASRRYDNKDKPNDFLEILKVLQNDMYQMNNQIQSLMRPPSHQAAQNTLPPRPPNAWVNQQNQQIFPTPATAFAWPPAQQC